MFTNVPCPLIYPHSTMLVARVFSGNWLPVWETLEYTISRPNVSTRGSKARKQNFSSPYDVINAEASPIASPSNAGDR